MGTTFKKSELTTSARVYRIAIGSLFIGIVMNTAGPLGYLAVLPLLAIYPILTGLFGEDPLDSLLDNWQGGFEGKRFRPSSRVALLVLSGTAIGVLMVSPEIVGIRAALALVAVYSIMAGLFGEDLFRVAFTRKGQPDVHPSVVEIEHLEATVLHHRFGHEHGKNHKIA